MLNDKWGSVSQDNKPCRERSIMAQKKNRMIAYIDIVLEVEYDWDSDKISRINVINKDDWMITC